MIYGRYWRRKESSSGGAGLASGYGRAMSQAGKKAAQRRFGIVAHVTGVLQNEYKRIDEAAQARQKIWNRVSRHYEKMLELCPEASDRELTELLLQSLRAGQKEDKKSTKPLFSRTL